MSGLEGGRIVLFTFRPLPGEIDHSYSAGGQLLFQDSPFRHSSWEGRSFGRPAFDYHDHAPQSFAVTLPEGFNEGGDARAHFGLYGTHGALGYTMRVLGP